MAGNQTSDNQAILKSNEWKIVIVVLYSIIFLLGTTGNLLVVYIFGWLKRGKRKTSELLLLSLGICDLLTCISLPPMMIIVALTAGKRIWFVVGCQVMPFFLCMCITVTQVILIIICFDRYRVIVTPLQKTVCWRLLTVGVVVGCILGIALNIPMLLQANNSQLDTGVCFDYANKPALTISQTSAFVVRDMLSFGVMAYFIRKMVIALNKSALFRKNLSTNDSVEDEEEFSRTRKLLYTVLIVFAICIWPADISSFILFTYYGGAKYSDDVTEKIVAIKSSIMMLQTINSCANVFIYSAIHPDFKKLLRRLKDALSR